MNQLKIYNEDGKELVFITKEHFEQWRDETYLLSALEAQGVKQWEKYDKAVEMISLCTRHVANLVKEVKGL